MKSATVRFFQVLSPLAVLLVHGMLYNPIGELAALRGTDFSAFIKTPLDALVPYVPLFVLPYLFIWFFPVVLMGGLYRNLGMRDPAPYLRLSLALLALMGICYTIWILLPVRVDLRIDEAVLRQGGFLDELVRRNYKVASLWNACPSFHVASPWFLYRILRHHVPGRHPVFFFLALSIIASTVFIRIHYLADIVGGVLVSELIFRVILLRRERAEA
jgi:hypothetical protein